MIYNRGMSKIRNGAKLPRNILDVRAKHYAAKGKGADNLIFSDVDTLKLSDKISGVSGGSDFFKGRAGVIASELENQKRAVEVVMETESDSLKPAPAA